MLALEREDVPMQEIKDAGHDEEINGKPSSSL